jgi:curved DNA-binding protein CbpA
MIDRDAYEVLQVHPRAHHLVIQAAFRTLAALYHPDRDDSEASTRRMAELNIAYAKVRTLELRELYDRERKVRHEPAAPVVPPYHPAGASARTDDAGPDVLDFGRYNGYTIRQLARHDPEYLRWLSRHSSGIRYRRQIEAALRDVAGPTTSERVRTRRSP